MGSASLSDEGHHQWRSHVLACGCGCTPPPKSKNKLLPSDFDPVCTPLGPICCTHHSPAQAASPVNLSPSQEASKMKSAARIRVFPRGSHPSRRRPTVSLPIPSVPVHCASAFCDPARRRVGDSCASASGAVEHLCNPAGGG